MPLRVVVHCGKAARRRTLADRARWQGRGQIGRPPGRAAVFLVRRGGSAGGGDVARGARGVRLRHHHPRHRRARCSRAAAGRVGRRGLAGARVMEPGDGKFVFGVDPKTVRRAARRRTVVADAARRAARSIAQYAVQLSGRRRRRSIGADQPRLRRSGLFLARLFRLQDGTAVRLFELLARRRRPRAEMLLVADQSQSSRGGAAAGTGGGFRRLFAGGGRRRAVRRRARAGDRRQHRFLFRAAGASRRCARAPSTPIRTGTS